MAVSPLILDGYSLSRLQWQERPATGDSVEDAFENAFETTTSISKHPTDPSAWQVILSIKSVDKTKKNPVSFLIEYAGYFRVHSDYPADQSETLVSVNGSSILFAAAREMLLLISGRSVSGPIVLPSMSFLDAPKLKKPVRKKQIGPKKPTPKAKSKAKVPSTKKTT